jgi:CHAD domain-containing protein
MPKKRKKIWDPSKSPEENAKLALPALASQYFQAGRKVVGRQVSPNDLHSFRLETKRFRYTVELFRPCYGPGLDRRLAALRRIQQYLGDISDCGTTQALLGRMKLRPPSQSATAGKFLESRAAARAAEFQEYWKETFDVPGRERWWTDYLRRFAGRSTAGKRKK